MLVSGRRCRAFFRVLPPLLYSVPPVGWSGWCVCSCLGAASSAMFSRVCFVRPRLIGVASAALLPGCVPVFRVHSSLPCCGVFCIFLASSHFFVLFALACSFCSWPLLPAGFHFLSSQTRPAGLLVRSKHRAFFCPCRPCLPKLDLFTPMLVSRPPLRHPL